MFSSLCSELLSGTFRDISVYGWSAGYTLLFYFFVWHDDPFRIEIPILVSLWLTSRHTSPRFGSSSFNRCSIFFSFLVSARTSSAYARTTGSLRLFWGYLKFLILSHVFCTGLSKVIMNSLGDSDHFCFTLLFFSCGLSEKIPWEF